jgi:hypothetical protein
MIIPNTATIAVEKIRDYLLVPLEEDDKSGYLSLAGYTREDYWELLRDIREQLLPGEAEFQERNEYGEYYMLEGRLIGPNGRTLGVRTIWLCEINGAIRFLTLFPD